MHSGKFVFFIFCHSVNFHRNLVVLFCSKITSKLIITLNMVNNEWHWGNNRKTIHFPNLHNKLLWFLLKWQEGYTKRTIIIVNLMPPQFSLQTAVISFHSIIYVLVNNALLHNTCNNDLGILVTWSTGDQCCWRMLDTWNMHTLHLV